MRDEVRHPSLCIHGNERAKNSLRFSRVVLRQTSSAEGRGKKEGCAGSLVTRPFFFFSFFSPQPVRDSSKVQRNERKGAWPRVHGSGSLLRFLVSPSLRFALLAPGTASN